MKNEIRSKQADYQYALEGMYYAQQIINRTKEDFDNTFVEINNPEVMGGETGKDYCKRMEQVVAILDSIIKKYNAFANKITEVCNENGHYIDTTMMGDFDAMQKKFAAKAEEINRFNGSKKA